MSARRTLINASLITLLGCGGGQTTDDGTQSLDVEAQTPTQLDGAMPEGDPPMQLHTTEPLDAEVQTPTQLDGAMPEGDPPIELESTPELDVEEQTPTQLDGDMPAGDSTMQSVHSDPDAQPELMAIGEIGGDAPTGASYAVERPQRAGGFSDPEFTRATESEPVGPPSPDRACTYDMYNWSVDEGRSVNHRHIETTVGELADDEIDPNDPRCTVCSEDQVRIDPSLYGWPDVDAFEVCVHYESEVLHALEVIEESGEFTITEITGYRSGRTRGRVENGMRMEMSNHAYGTAIDINARYNGLYGSCYGEVTADSIEDCSLRVGGEWDPDARPELTITRDSIVYELFTGVVGWRWGGEIDGSTKDMMHFSLDGY